MILVGIVTKYFILIKMLFTTIYYLPIINPKLVSLKKKLIFPFLLTNLFISSKPKNHFGGH